jgi:hypothetical protein
MEVVVPLTEFYKQPTIQFMAGFLADAEREAASPIAPVEKREYYPVSYIQNRIFVMEQLGEREQSTAYNNVLAMLVEGGLDRSRLERSIHSLIRRHESLRTSFELVEDQPAQRVFDEVEFSLEYPDAASSGVILEPDRRPTWQEVNLLIRDFIRPFDLKEAPLFRMAVIEFSSTGHLLLYDMHHMISDGTTFAVLTADFIDFYQGGEPEPLEVQYKDFSWWLYHGAGREEILKQEDYWLRRLSGERPVLDMRTDFPRPALQSFEGDYLLHLLPAERLARLNGLVKETETTFYIMMLALFNVLLSKYTGQEDIIIGSPAAARDRRQLEPIAGVFINALAMRNFPGSHLTFKEFLETVKTGSLEAFEHQGYPFGRLMEQLGEPKDLGRNPIYDFELIVQNIEAPRMESGELRFIPYTPDLKTAQTDISVEAREAMGRMVLKFSYCTRLFKRETMERFVGHFEEVVSAVLDDPAAVLGDIRISHELDTANVALLREEEAGDFGF